MTLQLKISGVFGAVAAGVWLNGSHDLNNNYVPVEARIVASTTECYIKSGRKSVVNKSDDSLAYMPCRDAPTVARQFGYSSKDIKYRTTYKFRYRSPVNGSYQRGEHTDSSAKPHEYTRGKKIKVYAHKEQAGSYRIR